MGTLKPERVTVTLERDGSILLVKDVPANVCQNCGERYYDSSTTDELLTLADRAFSQGAELEIIRMQVAA